MHKGERIQTGAYSDMCEQILTIKTEDIRKYTDKIKGVEKAGDRAVQQGAYDLKVYNAYGENEYVAYRTDDELEIVTLMVS